jgi:hypothetical protein
VIISRFCSVWLRSELLVRKICQEISLYVILRKVMLYQVLEEEVQATKILSRKSIF